MHTILRRGKDLAFYFDLFSEVYQKLCNGGRDRSTARAALAEEFFWNTIDAEHWIFGPVCDERRLFIEVFCHFV